MGEIDRKDVAGVRLLQASGHRSYDADHNAESEADRECRERRCQDKADATGKESQPNNT